MKIEKRREELDKERRRRVLIGYTGNNERRKELTRGEILAEEEK